MTLEPKIIYEDDNTLVLDKPAGLSVHSDGLNKELTIADWLSREYPDLIGVGEDLVLASGKKVSKPGIVHRLDKETSGVLLVAKNQPTYLFFKRQFKDRQVRKVYLALVTGEIKFKPEERERLINLPIGRSRHDARRRLAGRQADGPLREAMTYYSIKEIFPKYTFVEARPKTGRTHQLRVHFKAIGHPIVCDRLYFPEGACLPELDRLALHAHKLTCRLPGLGEREFVASIPADLKEALDNLAKL